MQILYHFLYAEIFSNLCRGRASQEQRLADIEGIPYLLQLFTCTTVSVGGWSSVRALSSEVMSLVDRDDRCTEYDNSLPFQQSLP